MAIVSEFEIAPDEFVLGEILTGPLDVEIVVERIVPSNGRMLPYLWVGGTDASRFDEWAERSRDVESVERLERSNDWHLFWIGWASEVQRLLSGFTNTRATILEARGTDRWRFRSRFPTRASLSTFNASCEASGIDITVTRVHTDPTIPDSGVDLTPLQRETLELAVESGYFDIPRQLTLSDLAAELEISTQAASERLRRGTHAVLASMLRDEHRRPPR